MDILELLRSQRAQNRGSKPRDWYSVRNLADGEAEIFIYDVIGESWFGGVTAADFVRDLRAITANKILLRINSPGGAIVDAIAIRTALNEHPAEIESHIDGLAASSASWVALAADKVVIAPHASMMIHEPFDFAYGDSVAMRKSADMLDRFGDEIASMYAEKAGGETSEWRDSMRAETWYTDEEAVDAGLADEIAGEAAAENRYDSAILNIFKNTPEHLAAPKAAPRKSRNRAAKPAAAAPCPELQTAELIYLRDQSRRLGVA